MRLRDTTHRYTILLPDAMFIIAGVGEVKYIDPSN